MLHFRHIIKGYFKLSGPLTELTEGIKNDPVNLIKKEIEAWKEIRDVITTLPAVCVFDWRKPVLLETDANQNYVGACLLQPYLHGENSVLHPVAYFSKKLTETRKRYSSQEGELLGILLSLQHWRLWVEGGDVALVTDHESLKTLNKNIEPSNRILHFLDAIEHHGVKIVCISGNLSILAAYLSKPPTFNSFVMSQSCFPVVEELNLD